MPGGPEGLAQANEQVPACLIKLAPAVNVGVSFMSLKTIEVVYHTEHAHIVGLVYVDTYTE